MLPLMRGLLTCARRADAPGKRLIVFLAAIVMGAVTAARADEPLDQLLARAQQGDATAQAELGWRYASGEGLPQNHAEAVKWFRKAADQGNVAAQVNLGVSYAKGEGVSQDYAEAAKWYRKAADQGNAVAQSVLGAMYARGQGVPRDYMLAYMWLHLAAGALSGPDREAALRERELAASKLTAAQLTLAQQMAQDWKPTTREGK
jgi:TPR repeat protein